MMTTHNDALGDDHRADAGDRGPTVIGVGELLFDCFYRDAPPAPGRQPAERRPGGAPANVAIHAHQLGCRGIVCSKVGKDEAGDALVAHLEREGLEVEGIQRARSAPTGVVDVDARDPTHPSYSIRSDVAWDHLEYTEAWGHLFREARAICFGTLALRSEANRATIFRGLATARPEALRVYDVNLRPPFFELDWIISGLERCSILKLNREELGLLRRMLSTSGAASVEPDTRAGIAADADSVAAGTSRSGGDDDEVDFAFAAPLAERFGIDLVCITRGADGCTIVERGGTRRDIPGRRVEVVDAVGAGDAFTAGLIFALLHDWPVERAGALANEVGALVASHPGATPSLGAAYAGLVERLGP